MDPNTNNGSSFNINSPGRMSRVALAYLQIWNLFNKLLVTNLKRLHHNFFITNYFTCPIFDYIPNQIAHSYFVLVKNNLNTKL